MASMTSTRTVFLLIIVACSDGFNAGLPNCGLHGMPSSRTPISPLFYREIEPEISGATTIRPVLSFNHTATALSYDPAWIVEAATRSEARRSEAVRQRKTSPSAKPKQPHEVTWQKHYHELQAFQAQHGHCLVPQNYKPNRKLGLWVMQQRRQYNLRQSGKKSALNATARQKRVALLEDLGFVWRVGRRGPRGAYGGLRRLRRRAEGTEVAHGADGDGDDFLDAVDFERRMIDKRAAYSEEEMWAAWRRRFELFQ